MALPPLPTIRDLIKLFGLSAKQDLSQNFILDLNVTSPSEVLAYRLERAALSSLHALPLRNTGPTFHLTLDLDKIIERTQRFSGPLRSKHVLEVGPGPGSLTRSILQAGCKNLIVVEKDQRFMPAMKMLHEAVERDAKMVAINGDILQVDECELLDKAGAQKREWAEASECLIIGNLPFAISTPLLLKWIRQIPKRSGAFAFGRTPMALMFQKEVADRICASPGTKEFNRLTVMVQQSCEAKILYRVGSKNFVPAPEVDAAMVYLEPKVAPELDVDMKALEQLCMLVFPLKRKMMANAILRVHPDAKSLLDIAGIDASLRPEQVSVRDWCLLATVYKHSKFYQDLSLRHYRDDNDAEMEL